MGTIRRLVGVYNAEGTLRGELAYFVGARLGRAHCALCDVTHGRVRVKPEWRARRAGLGVPFDTYHRDDQPPAVRAVTGGHEPAVLAETDDGLIPLLGPDDIDECEGSVELFVQVLDAALEQRGLPRPAA